MNYKKKKKKNQQANDDCSSWLGGLTAILGWGGGFSELFEDDLMSLIRSDSIARSIPIGRY